MTARRLLLVALALLAGCKNTSTRPSLRLSAPAAVAVYRGFTTRDAAATRSYLAVANEHGDDLRILDAIDGKAVLGPALVQALSVPTGPRPALLAAGSLNDADPTDKADLLVVASTGLTTCDPALSTRLVGCVQAVATWIPATALAAGLTLIVDDLPGGEGGALLSLVTMPVPEPDGSGGWRPAPGRVRLAAGLTGGRLLLADYARAADGVSIEVAGAAVHDLGFDLLSLSPSPDLQHLYAASLDSIGGVDGVAELDVSGAVDQLPPLRAIPAGLPTTLVLAARVRPFIQMNQSSGIDQLGPEEIRVYATLDPLQCGRDLAVPCGLVTLDPVVGAPLPDPVGELPMLAPMPVSGHGLALGVVYPPAVGSLKADGTPATGAADAVYQKQAAGSGFRWVSTLAALASSNGGVYLYDLSRGAPAMDQDLVATATTGTQARVASAVSGPPKTTDLPWLGLWDERTDAPAVTHDPLVQPLLVDMTLGYTTSESWTVTWEGLLPITLGLRAQVQTTGTAPGSPLEWLALQSSTSTGLVGGPYRDVGRLYDPRLPIRPGDIVLVSPDDAISCPAGTFELEVAGFLAPDPVLYPGGAITVTPRPEALQPHVDVDGVSTAADPSCMVLAGANTGGRSMARVSFRAGGLVMVGSSFGYAGRPVAQASAAGPAYTLGWADTSGLSCPVLDSSAWPPAPCDQACRDTCEQIILARKARRQFYVAAECQGLDTECQNRWHTQGPIIDPVGPVLRFKPGWVYGTTASGTTPPLRDTTLQINTASGLAMVSRRPLSGTTAIGAALPSGLATFDRSAATGLEASGVRVFASYPTNLVLDFSPAATAAAVGVYK